MAKRLLISICFIVIALGLPLPAQAASRLAISEKGDATHITLSLKKISPRKVFTMDGPHRLVVDVPSLADRSFIKMPGNYKGSLIRSVRGAQFDPKTTRIVFELENSVAGLKISSQKNDLLITLSDSGAAPAPSASQPQTVNAPKAASKKTEAIREEPKAKKQKPLIALDPGHGGQDPGATGDKGTFEKDVVLSYAYTLKEQLEKTGRYRVMLTREGDRFIRLRERVAIARRSGASLFVSLHADTAPEDYARGVSVYTVSEEASDKESEALAAQENKADIIAGMDLSDERGDVADILISLAQRDTKNESAKLADLMVRALMDQNVKLLQNTHRYAGFAVLKAPDVPSVLVELGFLSNREEEKLLKSKDHRIRVTKGLASGIDTYMKRKKQMGEL